MKQVLFYDKNTNQRIGGIMLDNGDIICGCCGGLIPNDEIDRTGADENCDYTLIKVYSSWENLSYDIAGDDIYYTGDDIDKD